MNKQEAGRIANEVASRYQARSRDQLLLYPDHQDTFEVVAPSGDRYQIEVDAVWDDRKDGSLRVLISVDDGGLSSLVPLTVSFIV